LKKLILRKRTVLFAFISMLAITMLAPIFSVYAQQPASTVPQVIGVTGDVEGVHDPSIIKDGSSWYLFGTATEPKRDGELPVRCSPDLHHWSRCGYVLPGMPQWIQKESPETKELWAPDISYFDGQYHLYCAFSAFGKNTSGIALLTNKTLELQSKVGDDFNAIDPNLVLDESGQAWLAFGSFWNGIKMRKLDRKTGKLSAEDTHLYSLASRKRPDNAPPAPPGLPPDWQAIEAPFIVQHGDYYYLFVSFDLCCRGTKSTYKTMVGRSPSVTGPYLDKSGKPMLEGGGSPLLTGDKRWLGPGGESILLRKEGDVIVFHAYDATTGHPFLHISTLGWNDGWPSAALN